MTFNRSGWREVSGGALLRKLTLLTSVQIYPTNNCNANCVFCWRHDLGQDFDGLPDERWLELADEICALDVARVTICGGGEPLLRKQLVLQMMEKFASARIDGGLITNGMLITEKFAEHAVNLRWESIQISIHAPDAPLNDIMMGKAGAFSLQVRALEILERVKRFRRSALPEVSMRIVITRSNYASLTDFLRLASSKGASRVIVNMENPGQAESQNVLHTLTGGHISTFSEALNRTTELAQELGVVLDMEFDANQLPKKNEARDVPFRETGGHSGGARGESPLHCHIPFTELVIFANGKTSPCCNYHDLQFGNPTEQEGWLEDVAHQSIREVWQRGYTRLRGSMVGSQPLSSTCRMCTMNLRHQRNKWPRSMWRQRFEQLRNRKRYSTGIRFGRGQLDAFGPSAILHKNVGYFCREIGDSQGAIRHLTAAIDCHDCPEEDKGHLYLAVGMCRLEQEECPSALIALQSALQHFPRNPGGVKCWMASCFRRMGQHQEMRAHLHRDRGESDTGIRTFFTEEFSYCRRRAQYREGIAFGMALLEEFSDIPELLHHLGEFHMELGEYDPAIEHLSRALILDTNREWTWFSLGKCYFKKGLHVESRAALRKNVQLTADRASHFHSWLFLAMIADAEQDGPGVAEAFTSLRHFSGDITEILPLEREFLLNLETRYVLPEWLREKLFKSTSGG